MLHLQGKHFHYKDPETHEIRYQGYVIEYDRNDPLLILVQLFSFMDGQPTVQRVWHVDENWDFYDTPVAAEWAYVQSVEKGSIKAREAMDFAYRDYDGNWEDALVPLWIQELEEPRYSLTPEARAEYEAQKNARL